MKRSTTRVIYTTSRNDELEKFKSFLGPLAENYTEAQLRQLKIEMHLMAEILLEFYLHQRKS